jgi:hypothetical protein
MRYLFVLSLIVLVVSGCDKSQCKDNHLKVLSIRSPNPIPDNTVLYTVYKKGTELYEEIDTDTVKVTATYTGEYVLDVAINMKYMYFSNYDWVFKLYPSGKEYALTDITFHQRKDKTYDGVDCVNDLTMKINGASTDYPGKNKPMLDDTYSISY